MHFKTGDYVCNRLRYSQVKASTYTTTQLFYSKLVQDKFKKEHLPEVYQALCPLLSSYRSNERLYILKILALYEQLPMELDADHREYEECDVINVMLTMEEVAVNIKDYRDKVLHLRKLGVHLASQRVPEFYFEAICRIALGKEVNFLHKVSQRNHI